MYYGIPSSIKNSQGKEIKGAIGFTGAIRKLNNQFNPNKMVVVFDSETSINSRLAEDSDYKQNRMDYSNLPEDENPFVQLQYIYQILAYLSIYFFEAKDYEADDFIASICEKYKKSNEIMIVSTDKDFLQLVEDHITLYNPSLDIYYTPKVVYEKFEVTPNQIIDYKSLIGDKSDNIKGIPMIGPKTAVKILKNGTLVEIYNKEKEIEEKLYNKLVEYVSIVNKNKSLVTMNRNLCIECEDKHMTLKLKLEKKTKDILIACGIY